jgi:mRNA-degrading endonuclease RelE of RelBE toxin-antitoxin system
MLKVIIAPDARETLRKLPQKMRQRIGAALQKVASGAGGDVRKLAGRPDEYRLRVGDYRVLFHYDDPDVIVVTDVIQRKDAYR